MARFAQRRQKQSKKKHRRLRGREFRLESLEQRMLMAADMAFSYTEWNALAAIEGTSYYDGNRSGHREAGEIGLVGWEVELLDEMGAVLQTTQTSADNPQTPDVDETGRYRFQVAGPGNYHVSQTLPEDWMHSGDAFPAEQSEMVGGHRYLHPVSVSPGDEVRNLDFANVELDPADIVAIHLEATDTAGNVITEVGVAQTFHLNVYVEDLRTDGDGVFSAFMDVNYPPQMVALRGMIEYSELFPNMQLGITATEGLIDEVGAVGGIAPSGGGATLLFRVPLEATAAGEITLTTDFADNFLHEILVHNLEAAVTEEQVAFGELSLNVLPVAHAENDTFEVDEDSQDNILDVLKNDFVAGAGELSLQSVQQGDQGGTLSISEDGKSLLYTPAADFHGTEQFSYLIGGAGQQSSSGLVTVNVHAVNDPPQANSDRIQVPEDSQAFPLRVLDNDSALPDVGEQLKIIAVSNPDAGGTMEVSDDQQTILYTPRENFIGSETAVYTITDGKLTRSATLTVDVQNVNDPPIAIDDKQSTFNYSDGVVERVDVLTNDVNVDPNETLSIVAVGEGSAGGTVKIDETGSYLVYTPAEFYFGEETFTYTVSDGNGLTSEATVGMTVKNPGQNPRIRLDVNGDGYITALDALIDINHVNKHGQGPILRPASPPYAQPPFMDTNGDGRVTSADILLLYNYLNDRSVAPTPPDGVAGPLSFTVEELMQPESEMPAYEDGTPRTVTRLTDNSGIPVDFVSSELILTPSSSEELAAFVERWNGTIVETIEPSAAGIEGLDLPAMYVVRVDTSLANVTQLPWDLWELNPANHGEHRVSDVEGMRLLAAAAREAASGLDVGVNWIGQSTTFRDGNSNEAPAGVIMAGATGYSQDAFDWDYMNSDGNLNVGVSDAWLAMELAGALDNPVRIAVLDGGFQTSADFPNVVATFSNVSGSPANGTPNPSGCGTPCPWHGTGVVGAAMGNPDDNFGGAGPGGPVAQAILGLTRLDNASSISALLNARATGAQIINMSYRARVPFSLSFTMDSYNRTTEQISQSGALIFASAGNDSEDVDATDSFLGIEWEKSWYGPCENDGVICVGALDENSEWKAPYSNWGSEDVDIYAPGTVLVGPDPLNPTNVARRFVGTSAASPFAAGVAALIWASDPSQTASDVADKLFATMNSSPHSVVNGYVNAADAVFSALGDTHPNVEITVPSDGTLYSHRSAAVPFMANVEDREDGSLPRNSIIWTSNRGEEIGRGNSISTTQLSLGNHTITVTATDSAGNVTTDEVTVVIVNDAPEVSIQLPTHGSQLCTEQPISFNATSLDANETPSFRLADHQVVWRSNLDGELGSGHDLQTELSAGTHTITFTGSDGLTSDSEWVTVVVGDCVDQHPEAAIAIPNNDVSFHYDGFDSAAGMWYKDVELSGTGTDEEDGRLTGSSLIWMTDRPDLADTDRVDGRDVLGTGTRLTVRLYSDDPFGLTHTITLVAVDSAGNESSPILRRVSIWGLA